ncbi:MAG: biotin--[Clostridia bacterium]|nr:biotin--[acetyl-CoA-carboxylase] ligase [Clostridia bacterium]
MTSEKADAVSVRLSGVPYDVYYLPVTDSTNTRLKAWRLGESPPGISGGPVHGVCLAAGCQTAGRGRLGRKFVSPGGGLYFSLYLACASPVEAMGVTAPAAAAVCAALWDLGFEGAMIKWVNDIWYRDRKVCGILCEYVDGAVICGVGINMMPPRGGYPPEAGPAGALGRADLEWTDLLRAVLLRMDAFLKDRSAALDFYRAHQYLRGKSVTVAVGSREKRGTALDVDGEFRLVLRDEDGSIQTLNCGEVTRVRMADHEG